MSKKENNETIGQRTSYSCAISLSAEWHCQRQRYHERRRLFFVPQLTSRTAIRHIIDRLIGMLQDSSYLYIHKTFCTG